MGTCQKTHTLSKRALSRRHSLRLLLNFAGLSSFSWMCKALYILRIRFWKQYFFLLNNPLLDNPPLFIKNIRLGFFSPWLSLRPRPFSSMASTSPSPFLGSFLPLLSPKHLNKLLSKQLIT